ncbi:MAG TPA: cupin domain-containing protein [Bryobacteraceae bacterium]
MKLLVSTVLLLGMSLALMAAGAPAPVTSLDHHKVAAIVAKGGPLGMGSDYSDAIGRRTGPGQVEVHEKETDIFYVLDGQATFVTGGKMIGGKQTKAGQFLGTNIEGGETHNLAKGDFYVIPAGTPHWFKEVPQSVTYYVVKVIQP